MSILSDFEDRLAGAVDGVFAGVFRSPVQPVEIAKALGATMDDNRSVGVNRVYAPTHYEVSISQADAEEMGTFRDTLSGELATYVIARAQEQQYHLATKPIVIFTVDERLKLGRFKVRAEMGTPEPAHASEPAAAPPVAVSSAPRRDDLAGRIPEVRPTSEEVAATAAAPAPPTTPGVDRLATVTVTGIDHDIVLQGDRVTIGRLNACDICLQDANVSREHAAFVTDGAGWAIEDLGSTNGTTLNNTQVTYARLEDGDVIRMGVSQLIYHEPRV